MFKNYLLTTLRTIARHRVFTLINVAGLAIGMAGCILIMLYVADELSYDRYHEKDERIYRAGIDGKIGERQMKTHTSAAPLARTMIEEFPEVQNGVRFKSIGNTMIGHGDRSFIEDDIYYADSTVFDIFSWKLLRGNPQTALARPHSIVFTQSMAEKYFGNEDPMNKTVTFDNETEYKITGIMEDVPHNSHFHFEFLASLSSYPHSRSESWMSDRYATYLLLQEGVTDRAIEPKLGGFLKQHMGPQIKEALGISMEEWLSSGNRYGYFLEPLTGIYLDSEATMQMEPVGDKRYVIIFSLVALFILIIACVNFMNLTTAKASNRAREVGMRKVAGARRRQLIGQFLSESVILSFIALFFALVLVHLLMPTFNQITQKALSLPYGSEPLFVPALVVLALITGLIAGSYSSISLSSFNIITVLKGRITGGSKGAWFRSGLVVFQFAISVAIIIATFVVYQQLDYMQNKKLGFNKENVLVIKRPHALGGQMKAFKEELLRNPEIVAVGASSKVPGTGFGGTVFQRKGARSDEMIHFRTMTADYDFPQAMGMDVKKGRYFSRDYPGDSSSVVVNESAVRALGYDDPVGRHLMGYGPGGEVEVKLKIVGVMEDFHTESMHEKIPNVVMRHPGNYRPSYMAVRVNSQNISSSLGKVENLWKEFLPAQPFDYFFMDNHFDELHRSEMRTGKLLGIFSVVAIFIASMGLFGLSSFITEQRTKEIGVRKVMGSTISNILLLLNKQFTRWILIANLIAWPAAWYFMNDWLQNFAYRINLTGGMFVLAGVGSLLLAMLTVSYQTFRAANVNPAHSLRDE